MNTEPQNMPAAENYPIFNRTKIIATIGPATSSPQQLERLIRAGVDVCRINFSHGRHEDHLQVIEAVREINVRLGLHICLLSDLQGPKLRLGDIEGGGVRIKSGDLITITTLPITGNGQRAYITYPQFPQDVREGETVLIDDGKIQLQIISTDRQTEVLCMVIHGGMLSSKKGVNLPNTAVSLPSLTEKDLKDLDFALEHGVEWIGLSFVRTPEDITQLKHIIAEKGSRARVMAKIEKPEAVRHIDEIIRYSDSIMIARGDLGVELPMEELPLIQKMVVKKAIAQCRPVIIATQMLESMISNPRPTRAEANDVANAVLDGADCVMLSGETSVGEFPIEAVQSMQRIIARIEADPQLYQHRYALNKKSPTFLSDAVCLNTVLIANEVGAAAIISMTKSGYTAFRISSFRPHAKIFIFSNDVELLNMMSIIWGVRAFHYDKFSTTDETVSDVINELKAAGYLNKGDIAVNTVSMPIHERPRTNALKLSVVE